MQTEGVAPVEIDTVFFPPGSSSIERASFTIGLFDEDDARCLPPQIQVGPDRCGIMMDLDPLHAENQNRTATAVRRHQRGRGHDQCRHSQGNALGLDL